MPLSSIKLRLHELFVANASCAPGLLQPWQAVSSATQYIEEQDCFHSIQEFARVAARPLGWKDAGLQAQAGAVS